VVIKCKDVKKDRAKDLGLGECKVWWLILEVTIAIFTRFLYLNA
jgi:hypothetical protein